MTPHDGAEEVEEVGLVHWEWTLLTAGDDMETFREFLTPTFGLHGSWEQFTDSFLLFNPWGCSCGFLGKSVVTQHLWALKMNLEGQRGLISAQCAHLFLVHYC